MLARCTIMATLFVWLGIHVVRSTFTDGFVGYITRQYGSTTASQLSRKDLGVNGSFGGNMFSFPIRILRDPLILVHGLNADAGSVIPVRDFFIKRGYGFNEIYATSYGPQGKAIDQTGSANCSYVKQLRILIQAVNSYTGKNVVLAGYSLGNPIARKAVLGGTCVDTKENLGSPLTSKVSAFISVSGANNGAYLCESSVSASACNPINGFIKSSAFIKDINSKQNYEGQHRYFLRDSSDKVVGYKQNNIEWSSLPGSQINVTFNGFNHVDSLYNTLWTQWSLVVNGYAAEYAIKKDAHAESELTSTNCTGSAVGGSTSSLWNSPWAGGNDNQQIGGEYDQQSQVYKWQNGFWYAHNNVPKNYLGPKSG